MQPKVSIIIPVYNGSNYLQEAIDSALAQTYPNCEILVINDGSCDEGKTEAIALSYGDRIRYFKKENGGVASALNMGIRQMTGEYFSWLSHDDVYYPNKVKREVQAILASGDPMKLVQCEYDFYDEDTGTYTPTDFSKTYTIGQLTNSVFSVLQLQIHACCALIHKSHFDRVGMFDEGLRTVQDIEMWFRLFRGQRSLFVPERLYKVREHAEAGNHTIPSYYSETCRLYENLIGQLSDQEIISIWGSTFCFYTRMNGFLRSYGLEDEEIESHVLAKEKSETDIKNESYLKQIFQSKKIYIFGAGQYGMRVLYELKVRGIQVDGFLDNNPQREGQRIQGVSCYMPEKELESNGDAVVIVAVRNCKTILSQLDKLHVADVFLKSDIEKIMYEEEITNV